uniref:Uncharacterized protein n=1 Tax=Anguilla anguilla TaxID=7936 RepID=A0A0E9SRP7_ANGAN
MGFSLQRLVLILGKHWQYGSVMSLHPPKFKTWQIVNC